MIGEIKQICHNQVKKGWELCNGQKLSVVGNRSLFELIGYSYGGEGDFFNLPDLKNKVLVHISETKFLGKYGGKEMQTLNKENLPEHYHNVKIPILADEGDTADPNNNVISSVSDNAGSELNSFSNNEADGNLREFKSETFGCGKSFSIMQPYAAVNFIINVDDQ